MNNTTPPLQPVLLCRQLTKQFNEGERSIPILNQLNLTVHAKERIAIIGASGSGKSTLLHILGCLDQPTQGEIRILDQRIATDNHRQLNQIRNQHIGFVYQFHHLLPEFTLLENIAMPLLIQGIKLATVYTAAWKVLDQLHLKTIAHHKPSEISGGERQRTAIGRAMITTPAFILADEPTGNLDYKTAHQIIDVLCTINDTSLVIVTHDYSIAKRMDRILKLENGCLIDVTNAPQY